MGCAEPACHMVMRMRAMVIGGSVGGLFAANLLRLMGWDVQVFERATGHLGDRGTGIGTREELFGVMRRIGIAVDRSIGVPVRSRIALDRTGARRHELAVPAITSAWARIWRPLREAMPDSSYHGGAALVRCEQTDDCVIAHFVDGSHASADLLVAADGLHSTVRNTLLPDLKPAYAGYVAWRGVVEERELSSDLHDLMFHHMVFGMPDGELVLSLPMPGPEAGPDRGQRRCHFVWFRAATEDELADLCTDAQGRRHGVSIPPPLIRPELLVALKADAEHVLAPQLCRLVHATGQVILQPIFDLEPPRVAFGRVALLGDAAFVARPHVATGVMKAALDAECLAESLGSSGDVEAALAAYDRKRRPFGSWLVARGRHIGAVIAAKGSPERVETAMREYGAAGVVDGEAISARGPA
jgi:2-polyprenyl-6-methoxyphenol hydroxylase-like FAD-dependent oxidoreductase